MPESADLPVGDDAALPLRAVRFASRAVPESADLPIGDDAAFALRSVPHASGMVPELADLPDGDDAAFALRSVPHSSGMVPNDARGVPPDSAGRVSRLSCGHLSDPIGVAQVPIRERPVRQSAWRVSVGRGLSVGCLPGRRR
jgi:hypothetical protein